MQVSKQEVGRLFGSKTLFTIPFYQRKYVWDKEQWDRFLDDMEHICLIDKDYFMGTIILKQQIGRSGEFYKQTVIDGQQRMTTISIYMKALSTLLSEHYDSEYKLYDYNRAYVQPAIEHSKVDRKAFNTVMENESREEILGENQIINAYNYFLRKIDISKIDYRKLRNHMQLVVIDLDQNEDEQEIFDTINSLGVKLTTGELLKNYFFNENTEEDYARFWEGTFEKNENVENEDAEDFWNAEISAGRMKKSNIDILLYYYIQIKIKELKDRGQDINRAEFRRWDGLFSNYKTLVSEYSVTKVELYTEINEYAKLYEKYLNKKNTLQNLPKDACVERINFIIWQLDCTTIIPYVLYVLKNVSEQDTRNEIFAYLEAYIVRRLKETNKSYSDLFASQLLSTNCLTAEGLKHYFDEIESKDLKMPTDIDVKESVYGKWTNGKAKAILYLLESKLRDRMNSLGLLSFDRYSLEHLMPQKWDENWPLSENETELDRKSAIYSLGNMAIITNNLNSSISNGTWLDKLNGNRDHAGLIQYASGQMLMVDVVNKAEWNVELINLRSDYLAEKINEIWSV